ncbi:MAG: hypothetical protein H0V54_03000 [Chthoniobacterales bacterium]|nr:hypothetical protein [Chthoniobacterales bacterium]
MGPQTYRDRTMVRLGLGLAALSYLSVGAAVANAQAPVITDPGDLKILSVNTVFGPLDLKPAWKSMAPMPTARAGFAIAAADQKIYAIGGAVINDCTITSAVEAYDPAQDLWITGLAALPRPIRWRPSGGALGGTVYVIGGTETLQGCPGEPLRTVQAYDPTRDRWSQKKDLNIARTQVGVGADPTNNLLYAVGGGTGRPDFEVLTAVEVFDPTGGDNGEGSWTQKQDLNTARALPAVAAVNGKIYAVGGQTPDNGVIDTVEEFDPVANTWTIKRSRMPHPRLNPGAAVLDGKIYVVGGRTDVLVASVDVYDPALDLWTTGLPLPTARRGLGAAVVDNNLYAIGGDALVTTVDQQFIYQVTGANNPTSYDAFPLPDGLSIDHERGIISGTPITADDAFDLTFEITNSSGSDSRNVTFYIALPPAEELSSIVSSTCVTGRAGQPFAFQVLTNNASSEARLMATGLPYQAGAGPEMTIDPGTGLISGTVPATLDGSAQSFGVGLNLADGSSAQSYLQMTFVSDPSFPVITSSSNAALVLNQFFSYTIAADAPVSSFDYLGLDGVLDGSLPAGLSFDGATGTIFGIFRGDLASKPPAEHGALENLVARRPNAIETIKKEPPPRIQTLVKQDEVGTGTAPLNFFVSLHDFEVEALPVVASGGTNYVIFTDDPLTSGNGAGLFESGKTGDYINYAVSVPASGTYDLKAGIRTSNNQGIFQLSIDGTNQGSPQDEYSRDPVYEVRDLGSVTFPSAGDKTFQFLVTGRNPASGGYQLVFDYLDLVPRFEAETLVVKARTAPYERIHDPSLSGSAGTSFKAIRSADYLTYTVPVATAGIYNVQVKTKEDGHAGSFRLWIDGAKQGYPQGQDCGSSGGDGAFDLGSIYFRSPGDKSFQFLVKGCGPNSTGNDFILDYVDLVLATQLEAEDLAADASTQFVRVTDAHMSRRAGILLNAQAAGDSVTFQVTAPVAGTYGVKLGSRTGDKSGIVQLAIDGVNQGAAQDGYSAKVGYRVVDLGRVTFTEPGEKAFQFVVTGQNSSSSGYQFVLDYVDLIR